jgi:multidrug efflux pump subunit AcrA (membrane-fusion protein)
VDALTSAAFVATVAPMDTMKLLLGATVALLLGALAVSWQGMNYGVKNTSPDELARLKSQVAELRKEQDKLALEKQLQQLKATAPIAPTPAFNAAEIEAVKAQIEDNKAALAQIEAEKADKKLAQDEEGLLEQRDLEKGDAELKRARMIAQALLMGKVREYIDDAQAGGFIIFDVMMPEQVQAGTILGIRRKTGILAQFKVSDVSAEGGIANPLPGFGPVQPQPGDELILPPQY